MTAAPLWTPAQPPQPISAASVHIWGWSLDLRQPPGEDRGSLLSETERARGRSFHFEEDQVRFARSHGNLRFILGAYLQEPPRSLQFTINPYGKPALIFPPDSPPLWFNLAHTREIALLAVSPGLELGIDCEEIRPIEAEVAEAHFSPSELSRLRTLDGDAWLSGFYRCWTRKEAILKAEGVGLSLPLDTFDVSLLPEEPGMLLDSRATLRHRWNLAALEAGEERMAALATSSPAEEIACFWLE